ncbi:sensor domain-containing phosphodiesterase [Marinobacter orientalis]|uniref:EAL domain-containing protein n=1 Tax=Marinobacter orientalis TaxID=1928859 RepID=A0A7Y0NK14_9GAMM|nr:EAL domain-containing protein [Marinobacter orientalis]NMT62876.1 EAL domain-containing protein [Marinobacter orientalis]TGX51551.1 GGDEF and EAL domain-containing protein [Marinobacter orientalis]
MSNSEEARLSVLRQLNLLDTPPSESFDRITRLASLLFDLPIAAVSLTDRDRQWFKSRVGVDHREIPRFKACCGDVADNSSVLVINDLLASHYHDSHLAESGIRFYAGAPLVTHDGHTLGAMCVLGTEPRQVTDQERGILKDLAAMVMAQVDLQHAVGRVEPSTGLPNYLSFVEDLNDLARDLPDSQRYVLGTELVDLEQINALQRVMGPAYLDALSQTAARRIRKALGEQAKIYHVGPCQFAHLETGDRADILVRAVNLRKSLLEVTVNGSAPFMLRPVVGVAPVQLGRTQPDAVLRLAHTACRDARDNETGAGFYSRSSDNRYQRRFSLISDFQEALQSEDQLHLAYQPRVDMTSGRCVSAEALIRWQHPTVGNVSPAEFIPLVENTTMARDLTDWVMRNAIRQAAAWYHQGLQLRVSLNIAAANLEEGDFTERLLGYLGSEGLPLRAVELELTESGLISNGQAARRQLEELMARGVKIAIDDFGTGYSSLAYLQTIPAHVVKIDRSFITGLNQHQRSQTLVSAMIAMAHELGYSVVAEGVETEEAKQVLHSLGCDEIQGYLIARPFTSTEFTRWFMAPINTVTARPSSRQSL